MHGDDFVLAGAEEDLEGVQQTMQERFLIKLVGKLGLKVGDLPEIRVLNRILRWCPDAFLHEAGPRHAELLARDRVTIGPTVRTAGAKSTKE